MNTRKKMKIVGTKQYIDQETGEIVKCKVVNIEEKDANFTKIWIGHIVQSLELVGNKKIRLVTFFMENIDKENKLVMTQREMAKKTGISIPIINMTIGILIRANFLIKINSGAYRINPEVLFKGGTQTRMNVLLQYIAERTHTQ